MRLRPRARSLRTRVFTTLLLASASAALVVALASRRAASRGFALLVDSNVEGLEGLEPHRLEEGEEWPGLHEATQHSFDRSLLLAILIVIVIALAATAILSRWVLRPLEVLVQATPSLRGGGHVPAADHEVGQLASTLNSLADDVQRGEGLRQQLVSDVAHELRTPLTVLRGQVEAMQDGLRPLDRAGLAALHGNVIHLGRIVEDLQEIALAEAGELRVQLQTLDLDSEVTPLITGWERASLRSVQASTDAGLRVLADPARLRQILTNLLDNARDHTPPEGAIRVMARSTASEEFVEILVEDEGEGIPADVLPHVFERLVRGDPARSGRGAGLGLAIARELVRAQGGEIVLESEPGRGTRVTFTLPRVTEV